MSPVSESRLKGSFEALRIGTCRAFGTAFRAARLLTFGGSCESRPNDGEYLLMHCDNQKSPNVWFVGTWKSFNLRYRGLRTDWFFKSYGSLKSPKAAEYRGFSTFWASVTIQRDWVHSHTRCHIVGLFGPCKNAIQSSYVGAVVVEIRLFKESPSSAVFESRTTSRTESRTESRTASRPIFSRRTIRRVSWFKLR